MESGYIENTIVISRNSLHKGQLTQSYQILKEKWKQFTGKLQNQKGAEDTKGFVG